MTVTKFDIFWFHAERSNIDFQAFEIVESSRILEERRYEIDIETSGLSNLAEVRLKMELIGSKGRTQLRTLDNTTDEKVFIKAKDIGEIKELFISKIGQDYFEIDRIRVTTFDAQHRDKIYTSIVECACQESFIKILINNSDAVGVR